MPQLEPRQTFLQKEVGTLVAIRQIYAGRVYYYPLLGKRSVSDFSLPVDAFLDMFVREFNNDELDEEWSRLAETQGNTDGNTEVKSLAATFKRIAEAYEEHLQKLRELAKESLKGELVGPSPSADADANLHDVEVNPITGKLRP